MVKIVNFLPVLLTFLCNLLLCRVYWNDRCSVFNEAYVFHHIVQKRGGRSAWSSDSIETDKNNFSDQSLNLLYSAHPADNSNQKSFPLDLFHCINFTPDISKTSFRFPWRFEKSEFNCILKCLTPIFILSFTNWLANWLAHRFLFLFLQK